MAFAPMEHIFDHYSAFQMELRECIKQMREAKGLPQKEVANSLQNGHGQLFTH